MTNYVYNDKNDKIFQIMIIEMIIIAVNQAFVRLRFLEQTTSRNIIICIYFLFMYLSTYIYSRLVSLSIFSTNYDIVK